MIKPKNSLGNLLVDYAASKDDSTLVQILNESKKVAAGWVRRHTRLPLGPSFDDFVDNVSLEFVSRVIQGSVADNPISNILNIARDGFATYDQYIDHEALSSIEDHLHRAEVVDLVKSIIKKLPAELVQPFLYLLAFPGKTGQVKRLLGGGMPFYLIALDVKRVRRKMREYEGDDNTSPVPQSIMGHMLLMESLFHKSPALLVIFLMFKDMSTFLQFCALFSGETIEFPDFRDLKGTLKSVSELTDNLTTGDFTDTNRTVLKSFIVENLESTDCETMSPVMESFCVESMKSLFSNYDAMQKKLISDIGNGSFEDVKKVMQFMSAEATTQFNLFNEMTKALRSVVNEGTDASIT